MTSDLGKYLGVPLIHSRVTRKTYWHPVERVQAGFSNWKINKLSFAGRTGHAAHIPCIPCKWVSFPWVFEITLTRFSELLIVVLQTRGGKFTWSIGRNCVYLKKLGV